MFQDQRVHAPSPGTDAVALRMADHLEVQGLFERYGTLVAEGAAGEARRDLAQDICVALTVHITAEEELFYPAAFAAIGAQDVLDEASTLHRSARHLIADIVDMAPLDPLLDATVKTLGERIDRHMQEEDAWLLPKLRGADLDLGALGARMAERKGELLAEMEVAEG
jgi:hypothetical protein